MHNYKEKFWVEVRRKGKWNKVTPEIDDREAVEKARIVCKKRFPLLKARVSSGLR